MEKKQRSDCTGASFVFLPGQKLYRVAIKLELDTKILASYCWWCSGNIGGVIEHVAFAWRSALDCLCANI